MRMEEIQEAGNTMFYGFVVTGNFILCWRQNSRIILAGY
jgi:hypothetical protein